MDDYQTIYNRINNRKKQNEASKKSKIKFINRILGLISLVLAFLIYAYKDPNANVINDLFNTNINFSSLNSSLSKITNSLTSFFNFGASSESTSKEVSSISKYIKVSDYYYTNSENIAFCCGDGTVLNVSEDENGFQIMVKHDNGYIGIYEELVDSLVKEYDRVKINDKLGHFNKEFALYFIKDKITYSYEEITTNK